MESVEQEELQEVEETQETIESIEEPTQESIEKEEESDPKSQEPINEAIEQAIEVDTDYQVLLDNDKMTIEYIKYNENEFQVMVSLKDGGEFMAYDSNVSDNQSYLSLMFE